MSKHAANFWEQHVPGSVESIMLIALALSFALQPTPLVQDPPLARHARTLLGTPYVFGGRLNVKGQREGIDCQGTLFYALEKAFPKCDWRSYSVIPTQTIAREELGPIALRPTLTQDLRLEELQPGDFLFFLGQQKNPAEGHIAILAERKVWVWHTALYAGEGKMIVGDHFAGEVVEVDLAKYLDEHSQSYVGFMASRIAKGKRPKLKRCRRGRFLPKK